jgi:hypothetical protein
MGIYILYKIDLKQRWIKLKKLNFLGKILSRNPSRHEKTSRE